MKVYVVRKLHWRFTPYYTYQIADDTPVKAFVSDRNARRFCRKESEQSRTEYRQLIQNTIEEYRYFKGFQIINPTNSSKRYIEKSINDDIFYDFIQIECKNLENQDSIYILKTKWIFSYFTDYSGDFPIYSKSKESYIDIFNSHEEAFSYSSINEPKRNPFFEEHCWNSYQFDDSKLVMPVHSEESTKIPIDFLCNQILEAGLTPLEEEHREDIESWFLWWEIITENMWEIDKLNLRFKLGLLPFLENPFHFDYYSDKGIVIKDGFMTFRDHLHSVSIEDFMTTIEKIGMDHLIEYIPWSDHHWSEVICRNTDSSMQKMLWWLVYPFPYEIVKLELVSDSESD